MKNYDVVWVDAFTTVPLTGNACAVLLDARGFDDATMLALAREYNISETAYVFPGDHEADYNVRYWTPGGEIPLAGHPTIATTHALCEAGLIPTARDVLRLRMPAALVPVTIRRDGREPEYAMSQPAPQFLSVHPRSRIAAALGLGEADIAAGFEPETVSTGTPQLMVALTTRAALDACAPDLHALFPAGRDYFSAHVFARAEGDAELVSRHFADFAGKLIEDPFTGSATGGMAAYCARYGFVDAREYAVVQGMHVNRPGRARVAVEGTPPRDIGRIIVAGPAVTVMRGKLTLP
jgi:trans-2,3-dihydro-3-hydroxyanthranilate isomerase